MRHQALVAVVTISLSSPGAAQGTLYEWPAGPGSRPDDVASAGDVNGDGVADFGIVESAGGQTFAPCRLRVLSGADGAALLDVPGVPAPELGARLCALGDRDLDGHDDLVLGGLGLLRAVSGLTGGTLWESTVSVEVRSLATFSDLDADGAFEVLVGAKGVAYLVSGSNGANLLQVAPPPGGSQEFGRSVAVLEDFDGDGTPDFAVGDGGAAGGLGRVTVFSGANAVVLATIEGSAADPVSHGAYAWSIASPGDVDGDGVPELAVGSPSEGVVGVQYEPVHCGTFRLFSGLTGAKLLEVDHSSLGNSVGFGAALCAIGDQDGDGVRDLLVGAQITKVGCCHYSPGKVAVYSSVTGALLMTGPAQVTRALAAVPDVDADGIDDYLAAVAFFGAPGTKLHLSNHPPVQVSSACVPKQNSAGCFPAFDFDGAPSLTIGPELAVSATQLVGGSVGLCAWSSQGAQLPFGGTALCLGAPIQREAAAATGGAAGTCAGALAFTFAKAELIADGFAPGDQLHVQVWFRDPGFAAPMDFGLTNSVVATIWP